MQEASTGLQESVVQRFLSSQVTLVVEHPLAGLQLDGWHLSVELQVMGVNEQL
jgi:hypothetical protein